jgi:hypothetical protein
VHASIPQECQRSFGGGLLMERFSASEGVLMITFSVRPLSRAISTDILHAPARVVVTPADAPHRPQELNGVSERPMIIPHDDHAPPATTL